MRMKYTKSTVMNSIFPILSQLLLFMLQYIKLYL